MLIVNSSSFKSFMNALNLFTQLHMVGRKPNGKELQFIDYSVCHRRAFGMFQLVCNVRTEA
uniref:Uncharacterized protein n=1 Tax=Rhizophora mucronata TaxID=61149 RepID=A0A2P2NL00_RHIMU